MTDLAQPLYQEVLHPHEPANVNDVHAKEQARHANAYTRFNEKSAVWLTRIFQAMELFWFMNIFLVIWMAGNSTGIWHFDPMPFPLLLFIWNIPQLPLLPLLAISQRVQERRQKLQVDEEFLTTQKIYHDLRELVAHLAAQDTELIKQTQLSEQQTALLNQVISLLSSSLKGVSHG